MVPIRLSFLPALISIEVSYDLLLAATACMWLIFIAILIYSLWWHKKDHKLLLQNMQKQSLWKHGDQPSKNETESEENEASGDTDRDEFLRKAIYDSFVRLITEEKIFCDSQLTRDQVISRLGTSRKMFLEMLHKHVKMNFTDCINSYRLDKAVFLLENTEYTNEAIAEEVGFSPNTFYRQFRIKFGISPSEYKKTKCPNPIPSPDDLSM